MNALLLSRGDIEKMLQAFPQQSAKQRNPWEIFYSGDAKFLYSAHTQTHKYKLQFLNRRLCPTFRSCSCCTLFHIQQDIILNDYNFENES